MNRTTAKQKSSARPPLNLVDFCARMHAISQKMSTFARRMTNNMYRIMNKKKFFAASAWRLGGAMRRAAMALLLCMLTAMTAWANDAVTYIDMDGNQQTVTEYTEVTESMTADGKNHESPK